MEQNVVQINALVKTEVWNQAQQYYLKKKSAVSTMHNMDSTNVGIHQTRQLFCGGEGSI